MSGVNTPHPSYNYHVEIWEKTRACALGPEYVKSEGVRFLPMPSGFTAQDDGGTEMYDGYKTRAQFPDIYGPTIRGMTGLVHRQEAVVEGIENTPLYPLYERATRDGQTLDSLHEQITAELLAGGRVGLLPDAGRADDPSRPDVPWLNLYRTEAILNWNDKQTFYVLDESRHVLDEENFTSRILYSYRVLRMRDGKYTQQIYEGFGTGPDASGDAIQPTARGNKPLDHIPFVVGVAGRLGVEPVDPPLAGVVRSSYALYLLDADYRHQLFNTGQETFVVYGVQKEDMPTILGSGVVLGLPDGTKAEFVSPSGSGIQAHERAIAAERQNATLSGIQLFDGHSDRASGDALRLRYGAQTATLVTIAKQSAALLEAALREAGTMMGMDRTQVEKIIVRPNLEFLEKVLSSQEAVNLMNLWLSGAISYQTFYDNLLRGKIASVERNADQERGLIEAGLADLPPGTVGNPDKDVPTATLQQPGSVS